MNTLTPPQPGSRSSSARSPTLSGGGADVEGVVDPGAAGGAPAACRPASSALTVGGLVFGISNTAVTPPSAAAAVPVPRSSLRSRPGSRKCTWVSMTPGSTCRPAHGSTSAAALCARSPMATIRPARTPTSAPTRPPGVATVPPRTIRSKAGSTMRSCPGNLPRFIALAGPSCYKRNPSGERTCGGRQSTGRRTRRR